MEGEVLYVDPVKRLVDLNQEIMLIRDKKFTLKDFKEMRENLADLNFGDIIIPNNKNRR